MNPRLLGSENASTLVLPAPALPRAPLARRLVLARLQRLEHGLLTLVEGGRSRTLGAGGLAARVEVRDPRFWSAVAWRGSVGAGEAYGEGWWTSPDPTAVVRLFVQNRTALESMEGGLARLARPFLALGQALRRNTLRGSQANIRAHYDLSNAFFALFLDETLSYSCAYFERPDSSLLEASRAKIDLVCRKLELGPRDHLLEIGSGWGALAVHAARHYGCRVTTTTISREQHALAAERIRAAGLEGRVTLLLEDYRRLQGSYDKLVSIEMIEAVGHRYLGEYFRVCSRLLAPHGRMLLQAITIADQHYESARRSVDFIQRHIFPGSCIPSITALSNAMTRSSDLVQVGLQDLGQHYVRTLAAWRANLRANWESARGLGLPEDFLRRWEFYLCYCEGGYAERQLSDVHMLLERPLARA